MHQNYIQKTKKGVVIDEKKDLISSNNEIKEDIKIYKPTHIKKKIEYNAVLRALKKRSFTTAYMLAKTLHVSTNQVYAWLKTPKAIKIMQDDIDYYVSRIKASKDWKASAYLLDHITGTTDKATNANQQMVGLSIVVQK